MATAATPPVPTMTAATAATASSVLGVVPATAEEAPTTSPAASKPTPKTGADGASTSTDSMMDGLETATPLNDTHTNDARAGGAVDHDAEADKQPARPTVDVWAPENVARLKKGIAAQPRTSAPSGAKTTAATTEHEQKHSHLYECARREYRLRKEGYQREMTELERETLLAWLAGEIFLAEPPNFLTETHVGAERDEFISLHRTRLCPRLYGRLPVGFTLSATNSKLHLCRSLLAAAGSDNATTRIKELVATSHRIECSSRSQVVEVVFIDPEARDKWKGAKLKIGRSAIVLQATGPLAEGAEANGYEPAAQALLYTVHVLGLGWAEPAHVRSIITAATTVPIISLCSVEPTGDDLFGPHRWVVVFDSTECPTELLKTRMLRVNSSNSVLEVGLHHPRSSRRIPCRACLSTKHLRKECKTPAPADSAAKATLEVTIAPTRAPLLRSVTTVDEKRLAELRDQLAPEVAKRLQAEEMARTQLHAQAEAKRLAKEVAAAAQVRNAERQRQRVALALARQLEVDARVKTKAAVTAQINALRTGRPPSANQRTPRRSDKPATSSTKRHDSAADVHSPAKSAEKDNSEDSGTTSAARVAPTPVEVHEEGTTNGACENEADDVNMDASTRGGSTTRTDTNTSSEPTLEQPGGDSDRGSNQGADGSEAGDDVAQLGETMRVDDLLPVPTQITEAFEREEKEQQPSTSSIPHATPECGNDNAQQDRQRKHKRPAQPAFSRPLSDSTLQARDSAAAGTRGKDDHSKTLARPLARKRSATADTALPSVAKTKEQRETANSAVATRWTAARRKLAQLPDETPLSAASLSKWISEAPAELVTLIAALPYPILFLSSIPTKRLLALGYAINCETQLAVIRKYSADSSLSVKVRDLCSGWAAAAGACKGAARRRLTDSVDKWDKLASLDESLLCATVVKQVPADEWGALNVLCTLMPISAVVEPTTGVVMPQTKASLFHTSLPVQRAIASLLSSPADWLPARALLESENAAMANRN